MKNRSITHLLYADTVDMAGLPVRQAFPTNKVQQIDPFLLLHHADLKVPQHQEPRHGGVGPHPHRGFSPVTFIFKGGVHHRDSRGHDGVVYAGGAQWMNAGMGIIHSERPPDDIHEIGGRQEIIQLWVNTPAEFKMEPPSYQPVHPENIPVFRTDDQRVSMAIVAGELFGLWGPAKTTGEVNAATLILKTGGRISVSLPSEHNALIYLLDGKLNTGGYGLVEAFHAAVFDKHGDRITLTAVENSRALLVSGKPLNEKVVSHGPFVMNTETQILEAIRDYQMGKMGMLIEE